MDKQFVAILQKLIKEQGKDALLTKGKSFLGDYTGTDYKKESRLVVQALEAGAGKAINNAGNLEACKKQYTRLLQEDYYLSPDAAADLVDTLALVLRGDPTKTASALQVTAPQQCRNCGKKLDSAWNICPYCGTAIPLQCRNCGKELDSAWKLCPYCGTTVSPQPVSIPKVQSPAPPPITPPPVPIPRVQPSAPVNPPQNMARIQGGTFLMGSPASEPQRGNDEIQHRIRVSSFYMGKYEVTQREWKEVMGSNPSKFQGDNLPVENVSWFDAVNYCNALSKKEGLTPAYTVKGTDVTWNRSAKGYRLPTEAEWEYAAKEGDKAGLKYAYSGSNRADAVAWYADNSGGRTHPVGTKQPNSLGIYDLSGNVFEWCWDWYGDYSAGSQTDPAGDSSGSSRVNRGGSWIHFGQFVRSAYRSHITPSARVNGLGFRVVRNCCEELGSGVWGARRDRTSW